VSLWFLAWLLLHLIWMRQRHTSATQDSGLERTPKPANWTFEARSSCFGVSMTPRLPCHGLGGVVHSLPGRFTRLSILPWVFDGPGPIRSRLSGSELPMKVSKRWLPDLAFFWSASHPQSINVSSFSPRLSPFSDSIIFSIRESYHPRRHHPRLSAAPNNPQTPLATIVPLRPRRSVFTRTLHRVHYHV
jgi:hypothetical protein